MAFPQQPQPPYQQPFPQQPPKRGLSTTAWIGITAAIAVVVLSAGCVVVAVLGSAVKPTSAPAGSRSSSAVAAATEGPAAAVPSIAPRSSAPASPTIVTMPSVVGRNAAVVDDELRKLGFTNLQYGSQDVEDKVVLLLTNWTVTKQSTTAGAKVSTDTLIVLTCTKKGY